ncbi:hypothetical protein XENORESO_020856 [Xenotaenia resolanae]|uniref:Secreted protein n=1 Tax=Xenotaenia resolanae TaxID=208358 RepID=A0ABV0WN27_9TELE
MSTHRVLRCFGLGTFSLLFKASYMCSCIGRTSWRAYQQSAEHKYAPVTSIPPSILQIPIPQGIWKLKPDGIKARKHKPSATLTIEKIKGKGHMLGCTLTRSSVLFSY